MNYTDNQNIQHQNQAAVQIRQYLVLALEYWYLFLLAIIISVALFIYKNKFAYNEYGVYTSILIKKSNTNPELIAGGLMLDANRSLENEIGLLTSYDMIYKVIDELDFEINYFLDNRIGYDPELYKDCPFYIILDSMKSQYNYINVNIQLLDENSFKLTIPDFEFEQKFNFDSYIEIQNFGFVIKKNDDYFNENVFKKKYYFYINNKANLAKQYKDNLKVEVYLERSTILWIWIQGKTAQKNIDFINTLAEFYIEDRLFEKNEIAEKTIDFIDMQLEGFTDSLRKSEDQLQYFKQTNSINISDEGQSLLNQLQELDKEKKETQMKRDYYSYMLNAIDENPENILVLSPSILGYSDPILENYLTQLSEAMTQKRILEFSLKEDADLPPNVIRSLEIENFEKTIKQHIKQTIKYTQGTLEELIKKNNEIQKEIFKLPLAERQMLQITRQFDLNNEIYTFLLQRRMEAGITLASNAPDVKIVDKARMESVMFKGRKGGGNLPKNLIIAIFVVVAIIFVNELLKNKIEDKSELEKLIKVPIIASITHNNRDSQLPTLKYPKSSISETFRLLRTNLQYALLDTEEKIIVVSSTISGEGKSFISANLAAIISTTNKKVLLIGLDLRKPRVQQIFKNEDKHGVSDYLIGEITYEELIKKTKYDNLYIAPPGNIPPNPAELIESKKMTDFLEKVKKDFDYVIIDTPPVGIVADALLLTQKANAFLYVIRQKYSSKSSVRLLGEIIENNQLKNVNIIFNGIKKSVTQGLKYGYGYGYGYGSTYGQGYYDDDTNGAENEKGFLKRINEKILSKVLKFFSRR